VLFVITLVAVVGVESYFLFRPQSKTPPAIAVIDNFFGWKYAPGKYPVAAFPVTGSGHLAYSDIRDPGGIPEGLPVRLKVPIIGVDTAIEDAYMTPEGRMDVPEGSINVAWFALGPHPGEVGSAVIGGHFGMRNGVPFVFYDLDKLQVGDRVYILNDKDETLQFVVRSVKLFDRKADATEVFTSDDGLAHLNLITCEGVWNEINGFYPQRRVVFTDLAPKASVVASSTPAFNRVLNVGAEGADVVALQDILEQKGFLKLPTGTAKGYFDKVTSNALARYQKSVGLPVVGMFGPMTRAKIISEIATIGVPNAGSNAVFTTSSSASTVTPRSGGKLSTPPERFMEALRGLFKTPLDMLVTLSLCIAIAFMLFKVIRGRMSLRRWWNKRSRAPLSSKKK